MARTPLRQDSPAMMWVQCAQVHVNVLHEAHAIPERSERPAGRLATRKSSRPTLREVDDLRRQDAEDESGGAPARS
jgi:hypothetical protein